MTADKNWIQNFPGLQQLSDHIQRPLVEQSQVIRLKENSQVFGPGRAPESFLLLIEGVIRVQQVSDSGREIVLYRVVAGESCALTMACLMGYDDYLAEAVVEEEALAVAIPRAVFDSLMAEFAEFRKFVFTAFSVRVTNLFRVIDEVAFSRIDIRLAQKLIELARNGAEVERTHQQLASELGSVREVISRQLQEFQRRGWVTSSRGRITLVDLDAIRHLSTGG